MSVTVHMEGDDSAPRRLYEPTRRLVMGVPTEQQYRQLRLLASGSAGLSWGKRDTEPLLRRGWATAEWDEPFYQWVRITADGIRALARAVEKFGLPNLGAVVHTERRVCADCGSGRHRFESVEVPVPDGAANSHSEADQ